MNREMQSMDEARFDLLTLKLEQTEYLLSCTQKNLEEGDSQSAQTGICLSLDLIECIRRILLDHKVDHKN